MRVATALSSRVMRRHLAALHAHGQAQISESEPANPALITLGAALRDTTLARWRDARRDAGWTVLLIQPPSLAGAIWFGDLHAALGHLGVTCQLLPAAHMLSRQLLDEVKPNLVLGLESAELLAAFARSAMRQHKQRHHCARLLIPTRDDLFADSPRLTPPERERLATTLRGDGADAYFSLYESELYESHFGPWRAAGLRYLSLPQACNPLRDYPRDASRDCDYAYVSVPNHARIACAWTYTRAIIGRHRGLWGGTGWGFGQPDAPSDTMPGIYARARIALAPLINFLRKNPAEISQCVFAAAACGTFQITSQTPVTDRFFARDELVAADSPLAFADAFEYFVGRPDERASVAVRALRRVFDEHTFFHRAAKLLEFAKGFAHA